MAKIVFKKNSVQITTPDNIDSVNIKKQDQLKLNQTVNDNLDNVKIKQDDQLRIVYGPPQNGPVYIVGTPGPQGPTGPAGGMQYFYSDVAPEIAATGDRWFHPPSGLEFTRIQGQWIQLYRNVNL